MLSEPGRKELPQGKCLVIGGGCSDGESSLHVRKDHPTVIIRDLQANHEEADTRLLFHAKHASQPDRRIVIHSHSPVQWLERGRCCTVPSIDDKRPRTTEHNRADNMQVQKGLMPKFLFMCKQRSLLHRSMLLHG